MRKLEKREKNLAILLAVVLAFGAIDFIINMDSYFSFYQSPSKKEKKVTSKKVATALKAENKEDLNALTGWGRDPFNDPTVRVVRKRAPVKKVAKIVLKLKAISIAETMSVAMINNRVLGVGDNIEGYIVKSIQPKQVVLTKDGQSTTLKL